MLITMKKNPKRAKSYNELLEGKKKARPMGRQKGAHLKPINIEEFISEHDAMQLFVEHPWIADVKLYENTLMRDTMARTNTAKSKDPSKWSIELSSKVVANTVDIQRDVFIKAAANLVAIKMFNYFGAGEAFQLIVQRYDTKGKRPLQYVEPVTQKASMIAPDAIAVKH